MALSYISLGDLAEERRNATAAVEQFEAARAILEKLTIESPTDTNWRQTLSQVSNKIAKILKLTGDLEGALLRYGQALAIRNQLLAENPESVSLMAGAATSEFLVGDILQRRGAAAEALARYQQSRDLRNRIVESNPGNKKEQGIDSPAQRIS
jgi:tetratricopeptide (TPR) repeat protein